MYNSLHYQLLTGKTKGFSIIQKREISESLLPAAPLHFVCSTPSVEIANMSRMIILPLRYGLRVILLSTYGSLHHGLVCLMILLKEQHHPFLQSTPKSRLTYSIIVALDLDFRVQSIKATPYCFNKIHVKKR